MPVAGGPSRAQHPGGAAGAGGAARAPDRLGAPRGGPQAPQGNLRLARQPRPRGHSKATSGL
eukprot:9494278-Pyramimonas_sp.AAC.1